MKDPEQSEVSSAVVLELFIGIFTGGFTTLLKWNPGVRKYTLRHAAGGFLAQGFCMAVKPEPEGELATTIWAYWYILAAVIHLHVQRRSLRHGRLVHSYYVGDNIFAALLPVLRGHGWWRSYFRGCLSVAVILAAIVILPGLGLALVLGAIGEGVLLARSGESARLVDQDQFDALAEAEWRRQRFDSMQRRMW